MTHDPFTAAPDAPAAPAAFGQAEHPAPVADRLNDMVGSNPMPAVLAAAAVGAGLMALAVSMARSHPAEEAPAPKGAALPGDDALRRQIADLVDRLGQAVGRAVPVDAAKQHVDDAGTALADGWSNVRAQAIDALGRFEPQAGAAIKVARDNPVWAAVIVGVLGALFGSQMLGGKAASSAEAPSNAGAHA